jgi:hypothetical protein
MTSYIRFSIIACFVLFSLHASSQSAKEIATFFKEANVFFEKHAQDGNIKYALLKTNRASLNPLIEFIAKTKLSTLDTYKRKAYLINCYNLLVINAVLDKYPIPTINDTDGFFKATKHNIGGMKMTLDDLEYKVIFKEFKDPRLHFVLVCAAKGCPPIPSFAYTPALLGDQMNDQCQLALDNPNFLYLEDTDAVVKISPIFKWYYDDFFPSIPDFINAHRSNKLPKDYALVYYKYDWKLNTWAE